jgi:hypothetical protein
MARSPCRRILPALVLALQGCGDGTAPGDPTFRVDTLDGVPHSVAADAPELGEGEVVLLWEAPPEAELLDGATWANPVRVSADERGVAVVDPQLAQVHLFSPDGAREGSVGRRGSGPGELTAIGVVTLRGDTLLIHDSSRLPVQLFHRTDGSYLGSLGTGEGFGLELHHLRGVGILRAYVIPMPGQMDRNWFFIPFEAPDERRPFSPPGTHSLQPQAAEGEEGCWRRGVSGALLIEVDCTFPLLRLVDETGEVVREHRIDRGPRRTSPEALEELRRNLESEMRMEVPATMPSAMVDQMVQQFVGGAVEQNRWTQVIRAVTGSPSGERILIWEQLPQGFQPTESVLHLLDGEGRYLVRMPFDIPLASVAVTDDRLYVLAPDPETDLRRLRAYGLP